MKCQLRKTGAKIVLIDYQSEETLLAAAKALEVEGRLDLLVNCGGG
jgi:hypothetical protein